MAEWSNAAGFDPVVPWFESKRPIQFSLRINMSKYPSEYNPNAKIDMTKEAQGCWKFMLIIAFSFAFLAWISGAYK